MSKKTVIEFYETMCSDSGTPINEAVGKMWADKLRAHKIDDIEIEAYRLYRINYRMPSWSEVHDALIMNCYSATNSLTGDEKRRSEARRSAISPEKTRDWLDVIYQKLRGRE